MCGVIVRLETVLLNVPTAVAALRVQKILMTVVAIVIGVHLS
jgi:hypothetical protein